MNEFDEAAYDWRLSQAKWHSKRAGKWHRSQARWYHRAIRSMPGLFGFVIARALRTHSRKLVENITANNVLLDRMKRARIGANPTPK